MTDAEIIESVLRHEGVWDHDPRDPGGETSYGISRKYHPEAWTNGPPTREQAIAIYEREYLRPFDGLDPDIKPQVVDIAVNCGVLAARGMLALALQDTARPLHLALAVQRLKHYARKCVANHELIAFLHGWINRTADYIV